MPEGLRVHRNYVRSIERPLIEVSCPRCFGLGAVGDGGHPHNGSDERFEICEHCQGKKRILRERNDTEMVDLLHEALLEAGVRIPG